MRKEAARILATAKTLPEGRVLRVESLDVSREAAGTALTSLELAGAVIRIERGRYVATVTGRFGTRAPTTTSVLAGLEAVTGERFARTRADLDNALGVSTQVPMREIRLTTGRSRTLTLGARRVELRHAEEAEVEAARAREGKAP